MSGKQWGSPATVTIGGHRYPGSVAGDDEGPFVTLVIGEGPNAAAHILDLVDQFDDWTYAGPNTFMVTLYPDEPHELTAAIALPATADGTRTLRTFASTYARALTQRYVERYGRNSLQQIPGSTMMLMTQPGWAMQQLRRSIVTKASRVAWMFEDGETVIDAGSARAEDLPGWPKPRGDEDFGGDIIETNLRLIYTDAFDAWPVTWEHITQLKPARTRMAGTTLLKLRLTDGTRVVLSGNSPFISDLAARRK